MNLTVFGDYQIASMVIFSYVDERYNTKCQLRIVASKTRKIGDKVYNWGELKFRIEIENKSLEHGHPARYKKVSMSKSELTEFLDSIRQASNDQNRYQGGVSVKRRIYDVDLIMGFRISNKDNGHNVLWTIMNSATDYSMCPIPSMVFETYFRRQLEDMIITMISFEAQFDNSRILLENQEYMKLQVNQTDQMMQYLSKLQSIPQNYSSDYDEQPTPVQQITRPEKTEYDSEDVSNILGSDISSVSFNETPSFDDGEEKIKQGPSNASIDPNPGERLQEDWRGNVEICKPEDVESTKNIIADFSASLLNLDEVELDVNPKRLEKNEGITPAKINPGPLHKHFIETGEGVELFQRLCKESMKHFEMATLSQAEFSKIIGEKCIPEMLDEDEKYIFYLTNLFSRRNLVNYQNNPKSVTDNHILIYGKSIKNITTSLTESSYEMLAILAYLHTMVELDRTQNSDDGVIAKILVLNYIYAVFSPMFVSVLGAVGDSNSENILKNVNYKLQTLIEAGFFKKYEEYLSEREMTKIWPKDCEKHISEIWERIKYLEKQQMIDVTILSNNLFQTNRIVCLGYDNKFSKEHINNIIRFESYFERPQPGEMYNFDEYKKASSYYGLEYGSEVEMYIRKMYTNMGEIDLSALDSVINGNIPNPQPKQKKETNKLKNTIVGPQRYLKSIIEKQPQILGTMNPKDFLEKLKLCDMDEDFDLKNFPFNIRELPKEILEAFYFWKPRSNPTSYLEYVELIKNSPHTWKDLINIMCESEEVKSIAVDDWFGAV